MASRRTRRQLAVAGWAAVVALPFLRLAAVARGLPANSIPWGADNFELLVGVQSASHLGQLTGPWSRLGFTHPGPLLAYWEAPWFLAMGDAPSSLLVAAALLGGVCFASLVAVVGVRMGGVGAAIAGVVVLAGLARADVIGFSHPWNPAATMAAAALLLVVAAAVSTGSVRLLPVLVLVGSFVAQTHLGAAPFAVVVTVAALVAFGVHHASEWRRDLRWLVAAGAVGLLVWLPVGIDQFWGTHNVSHLLGFAASGEVTSDDYGVQDPDTAHRVGIVDAVRWTGSITSGWQPSASRWAGSDSVLGKEARPDTASLLVLATLVGVNAWAVIRARSAPATPAGSFATALSRFAIGGVLLAVFATWSSRGDFRPYLVAFGVGVGLVLWLGAVLAVYVANRTALHRIAKQATATTAGQAVAYGVGAVAVVLLLIPSMTHRHAAFSSTDAESDALQAAVEARLPEGFDGRVEIGGQGVVQYQRIVQLVFGLENDGVRTQVPERFQLRLSTRQRSDGDPDLRFVLGGTTDTPPEGCEPLAVGDGTQDFGTTLCVIER